MTMHCLSTVRGNYRHLRCRRRAVSAQRFADYVINRKRHCRLTHRLVLLSAGSDIRAKVAFVQCCRTSTETVRTIRDGEPRTSTSTFTQLLSSARHAYFEFNVALRSRTRTDYYGRPPPPGLSLTQLLSSETKLASDIQAIA